jgi:signal transduction histidine kinase
MARDGAQSAAEEEARRLRDYAEAAADWFWEMDAALRFTRMSASSQLPESHSGDAFIGRRLDEMSEFGLAGDDWQALSEQLAVRLPFRDARLVCEREDTGTLYLALSGLPLFDDDGRFQGYRGIGRDLTLLKRAEQKLAETSAMLRATLDNMEQGLVVLDSELKIRLWNDRLYELFKESESDFWIGRPIGELIALHAAENKVNAATNLTFFRVSAELKRPASREIELPRSGRVVELRTMPTPDGGLTCTYLDITERKRSEAALLRAKEEAELGSRSKSEFLANMSHELRTPLNAIIGFADILRGEIFGALGDPRYVDYASDIRDSGIHLLNLINDVLDVSKVEFGKVELAEEAVDVVSVIEASVRLMRDRAHAAGVVLTHALPPNLPLVRCDEMRLKQILLNLLSNAVKFTQSGGRVTVRALLADDGLGIAVDDTGIGIATADLAKALRPFGQIDSRLNRKYQGTGLGLPLAKSMIEMHGGRLDLDSTPGIGTKATIWLPVERVIFPLEQPASAAIG